MKVPRLHSCHSRLLLPGLLLLALTAWAGQGREAGAHWSSALLREVLEVSQAAPEGSAEAQANLVLRSYQLRHLRLSSPGKARTAISLLKRLLPAQATLREDLPANTVHLLASPAAHAAAWELLSTLDVEGETGDAAASLAALSPALQQVLARIEENRTGNEQLTKEVQLIRSTLLEERDLRATAAQSAAAEAADQRVLLLGGSIALALLCWMLVRRHRARLALQRLPETGGSDTPVWASASPLGAGVQHQQLQKEMLGLLNAAAIRMEAWYNEQKTERERLSIVVNEQQLAINDARLALDGAKQDLLRENRGLLEQAGRRFEQSAERLEQGVGRLDLQHERVQCLASELEQTVGELDQTKDEMLRLRCSLQAREGELDQARERLGRREAELAAQQAKLAALTLILEESATHEPPGEAPDSPGPATRARDKHDGAKNDQSLDSLPCTPVQKRYQFLPPESPAL